MANVLTICRIVSSIALLIPGTFSPAFFALYAFAGVTDMVDGTVARRTGTESEFGAKLDSIADLGYRLPGEDHPRHFRAHVVVGMGRGNSPCEGGERDQRPRCREAPRHAPHNGKQGCWFCCLPRPFRHRALRHHHACHHRVRSVDVRSSSGRTPHQNGFLRLIILRARRVCAGSQTYACAN